MKSAIILFPGTNREGDMMAAIERASGRRPELVWHGETSLPDGVDLIVLPGGFAHGDYLRPGAIAARSPIMADVADKAQAGTLVLGVCNGFQALCEIGLLPGALMRNASLKFVCRTVRLRIENSNSAFTNSYREGQVIDCPVAHHDGNYFIEPDGLARLEDDDRILFRYVEGTNPNGSINDIAGIMNAKGNVLGMMPHPEDLIEVAHGGADGLGLFNSLVNTLSETVT